MRTSRHMLSAFAALAALGAVGVDVAGPEPRKARAPSPTRQAIRSTGKPPMNGKREVARRLRHIQRGDVLNHPSVEAADLVFPR